MSKPAATRLENRRIIIFGGGSGIGKATAALFAREGARLALVDRNLQAVQDVAHPLRGLALQADITDEAQVCAALDAARNALGGIDGLVITAGIFDPANLRDTTPDLWNQVIAVNLTGTYLICRNALPHLYNSGNATIVTLGSGVALVPPGPTSAAYVAAKGGVISMSRQIAMEAAPHVRVNCVCPGMVETPMTQSFLKTASGESKPEITNNYALKRTATAEEIAAAILFLTSSESSFVTGTTMAVDGGRTFH
ncbi:SDR family NAD(P)-dependent oxidoreductase [Pontitalea aquivivens]|jgi:NAD(P)-dependent dehydrogenase (short-subunit alcohol dehydrogenase family)|uniref:SDR family NAD(P)-dependent oxidoreductase n=1 Tax=Pontitalea aquivivens TaxID=3388663 RepID=UPI0039705D1A